MNDRIQDIYPLAPGQGGILFHAIGGAASGEYVIQIVLDLTGQPDAAREAAAWDALVARHDALRTAFVWKGQKQPLQVVGRAARISVTVTDLGDDLADWLAQDRAAGFDLSRAPLLRVTRFAMGSRHRMVVTFHHAVLDGWSIPLLLSDWIALYAGRDLPPAAPFRDHVAWANAQDRQGALAFWRSELSGYAGGAEPPLPTTPQPRRGDLSLVLDDATLIHSARANGLTLASVLHGAWALLLARASGSGDVVHGLARAGRHAALPGADRRVGMFLTTLPLRATLDESLSLSQFLSAQQSRQRAQSAHEHLPLAQIQSAISRRDGPLLTSAVVFENYPTDPALLGQVPDFTVTGIEVLEQTSLPLTLFAMSRDGLHLRLLFDGSRVDATAARGMLDDLRDLLMLFARAPQTPVSTITVRSRMARPQAAAQPASSAALMPQLAAIWAALLDCAPPQPEENFFDLGGHSMLVIAAQDRIRREMDIAVEIPDLFRFATLGAQSGHLARLQSGARPPGHDPRTQARAAGQNRLAQRRAQTRPTDQTENA